MSLFTINQKKCKRDGICAADCPAQVIVQADKNSFPEPIENAEEFCINCGHCVAVCPYDAMELSTMPVSGCTLITRDMLPTEASVRHFLEARRSIRQYKKKPVPGKTLEDLIRTARYAPTGSNNQQVHWMIFQDPDEVHQLARMVIDFMKMMMPLTTDEAAIRRFHRIITAWESGRDRITRGAPHLVLATSPADISFPQADCAIALTYLELYAFACGLGTCWAGYFTAAANAYEPLIKKLALPHGHQCYGAVMLGYPKHGYHRIPRRNDPLITWR